MAQKIETRKDEIRYKTLEPSKMLNKYIVSRVLKKWNESFIDEDTGETVNVERSSVLYERGTLITKDTLAKIQFDIQSEELKEPIEVSNQRRDAFELEHTALTPWTAKVNIGDKNVKFIFYATTLENVLEILRDYVELNYQGGFFISEAKEFTRCIILTDRLNDKKLSGSDIDKAYLQGDIDFETYIETREGAKEAEDEDENKDAGKKFYQLDLIIKWHQEEDDDSGEYQAPFVVHTFDTDRALLLINAYLQARENKLKKEAEEKGEKYRIKTFQLTIEKAGPIPIGRYIPKEFSLAYQSE